MRTSILPLCLTVGLCCHCTPPDSADDDSGSAEGEGEGEGEDEGEPGDPDVLVGSFVIRMVPPDDDAGFTTILGRIADGPTPSATVLEVENDVGDCQLLVPRVPFCNTPCGSDVCVEDDVCQAYPTAHSVGTVTVSGLVTDSGETTFSMTPIANNYQVPASIDLPYEAAAPGAAITLSADGGDFVSPFDITTHGIAPLVLDDAELTLVDGEPLHVAWTPGDTSLARITLKLDISHHGGSRGQIECDTDDTGSLDIDAALVSDLLELGIAGFPSIIVKRTTTGSTVIAPGRVDATVSSDIERFVSIPGLVSCTADTDCEAGQTCQTDLVCR